MCVCACASARVHVCVKERGEGAVVVEVVRSGAIIWVRVQQTLRQTASLCNRPENLLRAPQYPAQHTRQSPVVMLG